MGARKISDIPTTMATCCLVICVKCFHGSNHLTRHNCADISEFSPWGGTRWGDPQTPAPTHRKKKPFPLQLGATRCNYFSFSLLKSGPLRLNSFDQIVFSPSRRQLCLHASYVCCQNNWTTLLLSKQFLLPLCRKIDVPTGSIFYSYICAPLCPTCHGRWPRALMHESLNLR